MFKPMLAKTYEIGETEIPGDKIRWSQKLDGVRCYVDMQHDEIKLMTRNGKEITSLPHIVEELYRLSFMLPEGVMVLDGELYAEDMSFEDVISRVKRKTIHQDSMAIKFHVFDVLTKADLTHAQRLEYVKESIIQLRAVHVGWVPHYEIDNTKESISRLMLRVKELGWEGVMLRPIYGNYEQKRSKNLYKLKPVKHQAYEILNVLEGKGKDKGKGIFVFKTKEGHEFKARASSS